MSAFRASAVDVEKVKVLQRKLYCAAKAAPERKFHSLYDKIYRKDVLVLAWTRVSRNGGSCGVDDKSIGQIRKEGVEKFLDDLHHELKEGRYDPVAIRRVYIPKPNGDTRPLGIPTVKDRVAQMAAKLVMEPIFEADFMDCSYGFRPKRSAHQALKVVHQKSNIMKWVVDVDLKGYFDTIPHVDLMNRVKDRVYEKSLIHLVRRWLKANIFDEGKLSKPESGSPQGGVLSPLLSNIYLNEVDKAWHAADGFYTRYADDIVVQCYSKEQAEQALVKLTVMLTNLGLTLNKEKTCIRHVEEGFDFLGFTFKEAFNKVTKRKVRIKFPRSKSMKSIRLRIKEKVKSMPLGMDLREVISHVNPILRGWANYFKVGNSSQAADSLTSYACQQLRIFWRRRHQCKRIAGTKIWKNGFFYEKGLCFVPSLLS